MNPEDNFTDLEEFIPGSKKKLSDDRAARAVPTKPKKARKTGWDRNPIIRSVPNTGRNQEFFTIGALCEALGKSPVTIRKWIRSGWLPKARYRLPASPGTAGNLGKRLWSRTEIEAIKKIAEEEGIVRTRDEEGFNVNFRPPMTHITRFSTRVWAYWKGPDANSSGNQGRRTNTGV